MANIKKEREVADELITHVLASMEVIMPIINEYYNIQKQNVEKEIAESDKKLAIYDELISEYGKKADAVIDGTNLPEDVIANAVRTKVREMLDNNVNGDDFVITIEVFVDGEKTESGIN